MNIMMGIRMAVGRVMSEPSRPIGPQDMTMREKMTIVPPNGLKTKETDVWLFS